MGDHGSRAGTGHRLSAGIEDPTADTPRAAPAAAQEPSPATRASPSAGPPGEPREGRGYGVAILLAVAAVVAAIIAGRASILGIEASDLWQQSVEAEQRRGSILMWDVRSTYGDAGDLAFTIVTEQVRGEALREASSVAPADIAPRIVAEARIHEAVAQDLRQSSPIGSDPRYLLPSGGYDLQLSLADTREALGDAIRIDPLVSVEAGDRASEHGLKLLATTLVVGLAFLSGSLAQAAAARRGSLLALGWAAVIVAALLAFAIEVRG